MRIEAICGNPLGVQLVVQATVFDGGADVKPPIKIQNDLVYRREDLRAT